MLDERRRSEVEALFRRHGKGVGGYVLARVGDPDVAEAITGAVFLTVVRRFDQCRTSLAAWLWSIVRSELARHFRDRKQLQTLEREPLDERSDPCGRAERREARGRVRKAMEHLTDAQRELIYMKFFLDLPNIEIASALGLTPSNVGVLVHRTVKRLRDLMAAEDPARAKPMKQSVEMPPEAPMTELPGEEMVVAVR